MRTHFMHGQIILSVSDHGRPSRNWSLSFGERRRVNKIGGGDDG
jgi:hypothetical protein